MFSFPNVLEKRDRNIKVMHSSFSSCSEFIAHSHSFFFLSTMLIRLIDLYTYIVALPESICITTLPEADRIRYIELMQSSETEKRYFVKIMIVGKESAGKTSLLRKLLKDEIKDVSSTDGIDIVIRRCKINIDSGKWTIEKGR